MEISTRYMAQVSLILRFYINWQIYKDSFYASFNSFGISYLHKLLIAEGPYATKYDFVLYPDGRSISDVDLGELGGKTTATAKYEGNTLTSNMFGANVWGGEESSIFSKKKTHQ